MSEQEANAISNVWDVRLTVEGRVRLYLYWVHMYKLRLQKSLMQEVKLYEEMSRELKKLEDSRDTVILRTAKVIGMTTTGAARYMKVLGELRCPIVIVEEAAEVFEAHLVATLHTSCHHLILIGDHQQLRPSPTVYELGVDYNLDVSLFERLVKNNLPCVTLAVQHRMRPEVSRLVRHVYPWLQDHVTTQSRPNIRGVKHSVFFFHHERAEKSDSDRDRQSKSNLHEAELCVALSRYFIKQGYLPTAITILTAYTGQVLVFKNLITKDSSLSKVRVAAIDDYQGEENDIIILSLVRNNPQGRVGFLKTDNRVCVALSRAKNGLYVFGNFRMLASSSELWRKVVTTAKKHEQYGKELTLQCENHPGTLITVTQSEDFQQAPEGGCNLPCIARLDCGHACTLRCHGYDRDHVEFKCQKTCERKPCEREDHPCRKRCYEDCGPCIYRVQKTVPDCGHVAIMECSRDVTTWECQVPCLELLPCGHRCSSNCGRCRKETKHVCLVPVKRLLPCGHNVRMECQVKMEDIRCPVRCHFVLDCGHQCSGTCSLCATRHVPCGSKCGKLFAGCSHKCELPCGTECLPCQKQCSATCKHGVCPLTCGEPCQPCKQPCPWECHHARCQALCYSPCWPCEKPCQLKLRCGHRCGGFCQEQCVCLKCDANYFVNLPIKSGNAGRRAVRTIKLPRCGHVFSSQALDEFVERQLQIMNPTSSLPCPACFTPVLDWDCWRYSIELSLLRSARLQSTKSRRKKTTSTTHQNGHQESYNHRSRQMASIDGELLESAHRGRDLGRSRGRGRGRWPRSW